MHTNKPVDLSRFSVLNFPLVMSTGSEPAMPIAECVQLLAEAGLSMVDIFHEDEKRLQEYEEACANSPIRIKTYIGFASFLDDEETIRCILEPAMKHADRVGADIFMIVPFVAFTDCARSKTMEREVIREKMIAGFRLAMEMAKPYSFQVAFETTPQDESCLSGTDDCLRVLQSVPGLKLILDTANMLPHGDDPVEAYERLKEHIIHVHLKDVALISPEDYPKDAYAFERAADGRIMQAALWGEGVVPVGEIYRRMEADGFTGAYAIEYVPPKADMLGYEANLAQISRFFAYVER